MRSKAELVVTDVVVKLLPEIFKKNHHLGVTEDLAVDSTDNDVVLGFSKTPSV